MSRVTFVPRASVHHLVAFPWLLLLIAFVLASPARVSWDLARSAPARPDRERDAPQATRAIPTREWSMRVADALARREYTPALSGSRIQAPNRSQDFRTFFDPGGIEATPRSGTAGWRWRWRTAAWGRESGMETPPPAVPGVEGTRVVYRSGSFTEWYENRPEGLEQGFLVHARSPGRGPLLVRGEVDGLVPIPDLLGISVSFLDDTGRRILRYGALAASDAEGRSLPSKISVSGRMVTLVIDDAGALYPIEIDPVLTALAGSLSGTQPFAAFGASVSTAGDVNADGYSDVLVGAPRYDDGHPDAGRVELYLGAASGLAATPAWSASGSQDSAWFGASVAPAGDVNGDGRDDVTIGAPRYDAGETDEGRAFLYLGSSGGLGAAPAWSAEGGQDSCAFGTSVAWAGDVDSDGHADILVGAAGFSSSELGEGAFFLYRGAGSSLEATPSWSAESNQARAALGTSVAAAGDVNGDGWVDVLSGAPRWDGASADQGAAFVFFGSATGFGAPGTPVNADWSASGGLGAQLGTSVATAGDVNGDGYADLLLGAPFSDGSAGSAFLFLGGASGLGPPGSPGNADWTAAGGQGGARLGSSVATAGDVNGDGFADIVLGAPGFDGAFLDGGGAFVFMGSAAGLGPAGTPANADRITHGSQTGAMLGTSVAAAGDVNGDGYSDTVFGAPGTDLGPATDAGETILGLGAGSGLSQVPAWTENDYLTSAQFGFCVSTAGDVNGDGYADVIVGAVGYDGGQVDEGAAFLFLGSAAGLGASFSWTAEGNEINGFYGNSVCSAGDVNGDGYGDVVVGAPLQMDGETDEGRIYLYYGSPGGLGTVPWTFESDRGAARLGVRVAAAGDVNGDGYGDFIAGSSNFGFDTGTPTGRAYVFLGSSSGPTATAWFADGEQNGSEFGHSVASAGDVNGDGFSDVLVGARRHANGQQAEGRAYLFLGSLSGLAATHAWWAEGDQDSCEFGYRAVSAGDVNGDGYSDVAISAPLYDAGQTNEGRLFVYLGSAAGLGMPGTPANADWSVESDQVGAELGNAAASAGDVNGDGYGDLAVGITLYDNPETNEGRALLYFGSATGLGPNGTPSNAAWSCEGGQVGARCGISVGNAGDVNGDGFVDLLVGVDLYDRSQAVADNGEVRLFYGNGSGLARMPRQARASDTALIAPLGKSDSPSGFRVKALGRTPGGRDRVRLEWQVAPLALPFDSRGSGQGSWQDTGAPGAGGSAVPLSELVPGRASGSVHHWRARITSASPFFPRTPWFSPGHNSPTETDLRIGGLTVGVESSVAAPSRVRLLAARPNPARSGVTAVSFDLPRTDRVRLRIFDVQGRRVATLADRVETSGRHTLTWRGTTDQGSRVAAGVYVCRLECGGEILHQKITVSR